MSVIALANQKGGVAKTTSTLSLGAAWAEMGDRVLLVDCDPQAALTYSMGVDPEDLEVSLHDVFVGRAGIADVLWEAHGCHIAPATIDLAGSEVFLLTKTGREFVLGRALTKVADAYDVVIIDCPPSLGILTINALTAADEVIIPLQCESLSQRGMSHLLETIEDVRQFTNPQLSIRGVIATMFDPRTKHTREILSNVTDSYGLKVLEPPVRKSIRFAEAPAAGETIFQRAPSVPGAEAYRQIASELRDWAPEPAPAPEPAEDPQPVRDPHQAGEATRAGSSRATPTATAGADARGGDDLAAAANAPATPQPPPERSVGFRTIPVDTDPL
ncbi:MAG: AAA family ATPase [Acidimicrobiia bacterium]